MSDVSIYDEYLALTRQYREKYGVKTVVLMQVGVFFEVYGFEVSPSQYSDETPLQEYAAMCGLNIMEKKSSGDKRQFHQFKTTTTAKVVELPVAGAGFRDYSLDRYLQKLMDAGYTAVTYIQDKSTSAAKGGGGGMKRVLDGVHSSGTFLSYEDTSLRNVTNNICCLWIDMIHHRGTRSGSRGTKLPSSLATNLVFGVAVANMFTGTSSLCEWVQPYSTEPSACDKLERIITVHGPSEYIVISNVADESLSDILQFSGIQSSVDQDAHVVLHRVNPATSTPAKNCSQQKYVHHILTTMYGPTAIQMCQEFEQFPTATQAYCYLLDFVKEHNPNLVKNIQIPQFQHTERMLLANHTLRQLNIVSTGVGPEGSVESLLNQCATAMGRRLFREQLVHPTTDTVWLEQQYEQTDTLLLNANLDETRRKLKEIRDLEKMSRQLVARKLYPSAMTHLHHTMEQCLLVLSDYESAASAASATASASATAQASAASLVDGGRMRQQIGDLITFLQEYFRLDRCASIQSMTAFGDESFLCPGQSDALDEKVFLLEDSRVLFHTFHRFFNDLMSTKKDDTTEYVRVHETEKSGMSLQLTKRRAVTLKERLRQRPAIDSLLPKYPALEKVDWSEVVIRSSSSTYDDIWCPQLVEICATLMTQQDEMQKLLSTAYQDALALMEERFYATMKTVAQVRGEIDVLFCKAYIARKYRYCRPRLIGGEKSHVVTKQLRHALIEHLQTSETYVANDIHLGTLEQDGILLYGTNAVGKTSLIRALGIAVIMAQAGLYVPCTEFAYRPYTAIFSRILANDNLFKGLSTFAVEMSELRVILKMADQNSLILGDELCSGTETESALSIFAAGLSTLHAKRCSFIFATHFHEIKRFDEVQRLSSTLCLKHMSVHYDRETDALVYDRVLRDGPGDRMYGLEVCKSLHLPADFLDMAYQMRTKYFPETRGDLSSQSSTYNAKKIRGKCEICKTNLSTETHHVVPQRLADGDGFVTTSRGVFHKNHPGNLQSLCETCHLTQHKKK